MTTDYKNFNGKRYALVYLYPTKKEARARVKKIRNKQLARIVLTNEGYAIYAKWKKPKN